jgi:Co/Zn/Cd efflux system component
MAIKVKHLMHTIDDAFSIWFFHFSIFDKRASIIISIIIESIFSFFQKKKIHTISSLYSV